MSYCLEDCNEIFWELRNTKALCVKGFSALLYHVRVQDYLLCFEGSCCDIFRLTWADFGGHRSDWERETCRKIIVRLAGILANQIHEKTGGDKSTGNGRLSSFILTAFIHRKLIQAPEGVGRISSETSEQTYCPTRFDNPEDDSLSNNIRTEVFQKCFQQWEKRWYKCTEAQEEYLERD